MIKYNNLSKKSISGGYWPSSSRGNLSYRWHTENSKWRDHLSNVAHGKLVCPIKPILVIV